MNYGKRSLALAVVSLFVSGVVLTGCATTSEKAPETTTAPAAKTATVAKPAVQATTTQVKQAAAPAKKAICPPKKK